MHIFDLETADDQDLVIAFVRSNDRDALEVLLRRHEAKIYGLAYRITNSRSDALDVTQEVLLTVFRKVGDFKGQSAFSTWLYRLTTNACHDLGRKKARTPVPTESIEPRIHSDDPIRAATDQMVIEDALQRLIDDQRYAIVMRDILGLSYKEIAEVADVPVGTVKSRIARGRSALAQLLGSGDEELNIDTGRLRDEDQ
ncbi:MAG: sigma-70 family RNA polymerase sigma factor [Actinomycetota bacterium]